MLIFIFCFEYLSVSTPASIIIGKERIYNGLLIRVLAYFRIHYIVLNITN